MRCLCTKTGTKPAPNGTYLGFPILSTSQVVRMGSGMCYENIIVCNDVANCTETHTYTCPSECSVSGHIPRHYMRPVPCPPDLTPPTPTTPRSGFECRGRDRWFVTRNSNGDITSQALVTPNHPDCCLNCSGTGSSGNCAANPGMPPPTEGGDPWIVNTSGTSNPSMEYAFGTGQLGSVPCWMRFKTGTVPRPGITFRDMVASVFFPDSIEYFYSLSRSGIRFLNAPLHFRGRTFSDWNTDPHIGVGDPEYPGQPPCLPFTFGATDASLERYAYFTLSQRVFGDIVLLSRLWAKDYYYQCGNSVASTWDFLKSYFPLYIDEAVSFRQGYPSTDLTTHFLPGGVEVVIPTTLYATSKNTFFRAGDPSSVVNFPTHLQSCSDPGLPPVPTLVHGWDYLTKVWSTFPMLIRVPRCILPNGGTMNYTFNVSFALPEALRRPPTQWHVVFDRVPVDLCISGSGCVKKNDVIMVYDKPNDFTVFQNLPQPPSMPTPPVAPTPPIDPQIYFISEKRWVNGANNTQTEIEETYIRRQGHPDTYYHALSALNQQTLTAYNISIPNPAIFLWRKSPPSTFTDFNNINFEQELGYPDPIPLYNMQQNSLMSYYQQCVTLRDAYQLQYNTYLTQQTQYETAYRLYADVTLPQWQLQVKAAEEASIAAGKTIGVSVAEIAGNEKGGLYVDKTQLPTE